MIGTRTRKVSQATENGGVTRSNDQNRNVRVMHMNLCCQHLNRRTVAKAVPDDEKRGISEETSPIERIQTR